MSPPELERLALMRAHFRHEQPLRGLKGVEKRLQARLELCGQHIKELS